MSVSKNDLWERARALFREESAILQMEEAETDADLASDLASRAIDLADELDAILSILERSIVE